jgi:peptide chain release factor 1
MSVLAARIIQAEEARRAEEVSDTRRNLLGSGDRSDRIRTYNYPQGRVSDHRINLTLYRLAEVMEGDLQCLVDPVIQEYQADQLAALAAQH